MAYESFSKSIRVAATPEVAMTFWLMSGLTEQWFVQKCAFSVPEGRPRLENELAQAGDKYKWEWADGTVDTSTIQKVDFPIYFTSGWMDDENEIEVRFVPEDDGVIVTVVQHNRQEGEEERRMCTENCAAGWTFFLTNFKSVLEGGNDLREFNVTQEDLVNF